MELYRIDQKNRKSVDDFIMKHWFTLDMVVHGEKINLGNADGFYASEDNRIVGLITYRIANNEMEIMSLDSLNEKKESARVFLIKQSRLQRMSDIYASC